jgi:5'(3')-deoxyribonucleotidase
MWYQVAIDLDDVTLDFCGGLVEAVRTEFGVELTIQQFEEWDLSKVLNPIIGRNWWDWLRDRDWLWSHFPAVDGAIGGIERLRRQGLYLELLTQKPEWAEYAVWRWMGKWRPKFHRVTIVPSGERKVDYTDAELLVDDKWENCVDFVENGRAAIVFTRPWNITYELLPGMARARNWNEVVEGVLLEASVSAISRPPYESQKKKKPSAYGRPYRGAREEAAEVM